MDGCAHQILHPFARLTGPGPTGYITVPILKASLLGPSFGDKLKVLVCGPPPMVIALTGPPFNGGGMKGLFLSGCRVHSK